MEEVPEIVTTDQSEFADAQEVMQVPPEYRELKPTSKKKLVVVGVGILLLLVLVVASLGGKPESSDEVVLVPTLTPVPELTALQKELLLLEEQLQTADPTDDFDALPPVDMIISF